MKPIGKKASHGATLLEVCIVLAVLAVMMTTVVSFSALTVRQVGRVRARQMRDEDLGDAEALVREWISYFDCDDYRFAASDGGRFLAESRAEADVSYALWAESGVLHAEFPSGLSTRGAYGTLTALSVEVSAAEADGRMLLACSISAEADGAEAREILFLVNAFAAGKEEP